MRDFVDCYNEKITEIETAEVNYLNLCKERADKYIQRRQDDIKDQNNECSACN